MYASVLVVSVTFLVSWTTLNRLNWKTLHTKMFTQRDLWTFVSLIRPFFLFLHVQIVKFIRCWNTQHIEFSSRLSFVAMMKTVIYCVCDAQHGHTKQLKHLYDFTLQWQNETNTFATNQCAHIDYNYASIFTSTLNATGIRFNWHCILCTHFVCFCLLKCIVLCCFVQCSC